MYEGTLWLDYQDDENEEDEEHYQATINEFIIRDDRVVFEFKGHDRKEGSYFGNCAAVKSNDQYSGTGEFRYPNGTICKAQVSFKLEDNDEELLLSGVWVDNQYLDSPYKFEAELIKMKQVLTIACARAEKSANPHSSQL